MTLSSALRNRLVLVPAILYLAVALVCAQTPLLNYLGYEFSVVIAFIATFIAGSSTIKSVKQSNTRTANGQPPTAGNVLSFFRQSLARNLALLIIPTAVMLTNAFFVKNCSLVEGLEFFVLLPVVSVVFSSSLGLFCAMHYRWAKTLFVLIVLATIAYALALGYFTPAIFSYNFFYGYFPGLTYDEALGIGPSLVWFRLLTLFLAAVFVWMGVILANNAQPSDSVLRKGTVLLQAMTRGTSLLVTAAIVLMLGLLWLFKGELGFESHAGFIREQLGASVETEHFRIFYSSTSYSDDEIQWIASEHEFRLKQITDALSLQYKGKIESYIYPSSDAKQRLMGAGNTNIAKPWSQQIHITKQSLDGTLKHELVHVLVAQFGLPIINASLSTGLVEGIAMAIDWEWGNRTPHQYAAAMKKFGVAPDISTMMTITGFASHSSSMSYVLAGSFCRYLIDTYGIRKTMLLYRSNKYETVYNKSLDQLIAEWQAFLATVLITDQDRDAVDVFFRRPPIFQKVCARVIAARNIEAAKKFGQREYSVAGELYHQSFQDGRGYDALGGYSASALRAENFSGVIGMFDKVIRPSQNFSQYLPLLINVGLAQLGTGNTTAAEELFRRVEVADLSESLTESSIVCGIATRDTVNREAYLRYFIIASNDSQRVATLDSMQQDPKTHWLPIYLKGKAYVRLRQWEKILSVMKVLDASISEKHLEAIRLKTMGYSLFRLRRFKEAKEKYWQSLNFVDADVANYEVNDWVERCEWMEARSPK